MATIADYLKRPVSERLECMRRTPDDLADAILGRSDAELSRRPDEKNWSAEEIVCHLRDVEREYIERFHLVLENDDPKIYMEADGNERWPVDLQYHRNDTADAASAFRRLRDDDDAPLRPHRGRAAARRHPSAPRPRDERLVGGDARRSRRRPSRSAEASTERIPVGGRPCRRWKKPRSSPGSRSSPAWPALYQGGT
jgi:hypothetical protein